MAAASASSSRCRNDPKASPGSWCGAGRAVVVMVFTVYRGRDVLLPTMLPPRTVFGTHTYRMLCGAASSTALAKGAVMSEIKLPPGPSLPRALQGAYAMAMPLRGMRALHNRYGDAFSLNMPLFGRSVVISDATEIKQLFRASGDDIGNVEPNLGRVLGPDSLFALDGAEHRKQRKLVLPPFHGRRLGAYERIVEDETVREMASWPSGTAFPVMPSTMRITLNVILRAVFGAEGEEL